MTSRRKIGMGIFGKKKSIDYKKEYNNLSLINLMAKLSNLATRYEGYENSYEKKLPINQKELSALRSSRKVYAELLDGESVKERQLLRQNYRSIIEYENSLATFLEVNGFDIEKVNPVYMSILYRFIGDYHLYDVEIHQKYLDLEEEEYIDDLDKIEVALNVLQSILTITYYDLEKTVELIVRIIHSKIKNNTTSLRVRDVDNYVIQCRDKNSEHSFEDIKNIPLDFAFNIIFSAVVDIDTRFLSIHQSDYMEIDDLVQYVEILAKYMSDKNGVKYMTKGIAHEESIPQKRTVFDNMKSVLARQKPGAQATSMTSNKNASNDSKTNR